MKKKSSLLLLILLFFLFSRFSCEEDPLHYFLVDVSVLPEKALYSLGDTLTISVDIVNNEIYDEVLFEKFSFESGSLPFDLYIGEKEFGNYSEHEFFEFLNSEILDTSLMIHHYDYASRIIFNYGCPNGSEEFTFTFDIVLNQEGVFFLASTPYQQEVFELYQQPCDSIYTSYNYYNSPYYSTIQYFFDVEHPNLDIFYSTARSNYRWASETRTIEKKNFWFEVKQ